MESRLAGWTAVTAATVTTAAGALTIPLVVVGARINPADSVGEWIVGTFAPGFLVSGWWLVRRRPRLSLGWMFLAASTTVSLAALSAAYASAALAKGWPGVDWALWVFSWLWQPHLAILGIAMLIFPDGVIRSRLQRALVVATGSVLLISMLVSAIKAGPIITTPDHLDGAIPGVVNPLGITSLGSFTDAIFKPLMLVNFLVGVSPMIWTAVWWYRSEGLRRRQFKWVTILQLVGVFVPIAVLGLATWLAGPIAIAVTLASQVLIVVAILQWRAYELDVVVRRSVLALLLLVAGLGVYAAVVVAISLLLGRTGPVPSAIGAATAIFVFGPMSVGIRRAVNRLFYGRVDDPFSVVSELGRQAAAAASPKEGLHAVVVGLSQQLRVPYAAVLDSGGAVLASSGTLETGDVPVVLELDHYGPVGLLQIGHRRGADSISPAERQLLEALARQLEGAVAAHERLVELKSARQRLVAARQEERIRIQHDLHDGLGPQLTAVTLNLAAAGNHLRADHPESAADLIDSARATVQHAIGDIRRLLHSLGDSSVATLGLEAAIEEQVRALTAPTTLVVNLQVRDTSSLDRVSADAAFRIVSEATTNVVRHASARRCDINVRTNGSGLAITVSDDGRGCRDSTASHLKGFEGIGIRSMRERAEGIGGTFGIDYRDDGTTVRAWLPSAGSPAETVAERATSSATTNGSGLHDGKVTHEPA